MSFDYFYGQQSDLFTFYRVPKVLFTNERFWNISADAKMLYGILLDRMSLSAKNGWIDKNGRVYIIFTIDEAKMALNCAEQKAMAKRPTRLRFTEDDLADSHVKKAADRADKAVDKAEKAADKLDSKKAKPKLKLETDAAGSRKAKLRFEKAEFTEIERPSVAKHMASRGAAVTLTSKAHQAVSEYEDDNIGVQAVQETTKAVESTAYTVDHAVYSHKLKA